MADVVLANTSANLSGATVVKSSGTPTVGALAVFSSSSGITSGNLSGDVTTSNSLVTTIANSAVTLAKIQNAAANSKLLGSGASGSGAPYAEITLGSNLSMSGTTLNAAGSSFASPAILGTYTASAQATLDMVTRNGTGMSGALFQSDYSVYKFIFLNILPATTSANMYLRLSEDGGSTYRATAGDYFYQGFWVTNQPLTGSYNDITYGSTAYMLAPGVNNGASAGFAGVAGEFTIFRPTAAELHKAMWDTAFANPTAGRSEREQGLGWYTRSNAVNAARILFHTGNITSGTVIVMGVA